MGAPPDNNGVWERAVLAFDSGLRSVASKNRASASALRRVLELAPLPLKRALFSGSEHRCALCASSTRLLLPHGFPPRPDARCPVCGSLERHRLAWLVLQDETDLLDPRPKKMLHVAPEKIVEDRLRALNHLDYVSADLQDPRAMVKMDVTDIPYPPNTFDAIFCSHVLEHVPDDRRAMRELCRVLKPDGFALLMVPLKREETFEDPSVTNPADREKTFGQADHVRLYGPDFEDRLKEAGFGTKAFTWSDFEGPRGTHRVNERSKRGTVFVCDKNV